MQEVFPSPHSHPKEDVEFNLETQAPRTSDGPVFKNISFILIALETNIILGRNI